MKSFLARLFALCTATAAVGCGSTVITLPPAGDAAADAPTPDGGRVCRFSDGRECREGQTCPSPDGCNTCTCMPDGTLGCTLRGCLDGGLPDVTAPRRCTSSADCREGEECHIVEGCETPSYCGPRLGRPCTDDLAPFCGCDGNTFYGSSTCPQRTYSRRGPCASQDGGVTVCRLPDGRVCPMGERCRAPDGCNTCTCTSRGLSCTEIACVDGGAPDVPLPRTCNSTSDCPPSMMCMGSPGCGIPWRCEPAQPCTADIAQFCGCDGVTFTGSSSCPGRPFRSVGPCPGRDAGVACRAMDARGEGLCDGYFGVAWNGSTCAGVTGCRCVGVDCGRLYRDRTACVAACGGG